ncbi:MAG: hypothetical protein ACYTGK_18630 [Planctomycetota bacterium]|jgi:hypothetical protein
MKKALAVVIGILAVLAIGQAQEAEDPKASVEKLIQEGLEAYKAGKNQEAILKLQKAIGLIQQSAAKGLEAFLPAAPDGWKADPAKSKSGNWGAGEAAVTWTQASCRYIRESDNLKVEVTISDSPQIIQGQMQALKLYQNPQMLQMMNQDPNKKIELIDTDGWKGWKTTDKGKRPRTQTMAIYRSVMVMIEVRGDDEGARDAFWSGVDRKGIAAAAAPPK